MITIQNLKKQFANEKAICYEDMEFADGKSTLLNMIAGILSPDEGEIFINGENMTAKTQKEKDKFRIRRIGYIFQDFKAYYNNRRLQRSLGILTPTEKHQQYLITV